DWCAVDVVNEEGALQRLAVAHVDPEKVALAHELHQRYPVDMNAAQGAPNILHTGQSEFIPELPEELLTASARDEEMLQILRTLGLRSYIGVPLKARGRTLGVITLIAAESGRLFS